VVAVRQRSDPQTLTSLTSLGQKLFPGLTLSEHLFFQPSYRSHLQQNHPQLLAIRTDDDIFLSAPQPFTLIQSPPSQLLRNPGKQINSHISTGHLYVRPHTGTTIPTSFVVSPSTVGLEGTKLKECPEVGVSTSHHQRTMTPLDSSVPNTTANQYFRSGIIHSNTGDSECSSCGVAQTSLRRNQLDDESTRCCKLVCRATMIIRLSNRL
jgi:hypothetical protein